MFLYQADEAASPESPGAPGKDVVLVCPFCRLQFAGGGGVPRPGIPIERCWVCGNDRFYVQKDFNRSLGFLIVVGSAMVVFLMMLLMDPFLGIVCLAAIALVDLVIYRLLATCTVCYLCNSVYRGFPPNPDHRGFYLGIEEKFKKLRLDWLGRVMKDKEKK
jgi:hypothetical protein